jgi:hypothetical protein
VFSNPTSAQRKLHRGVQHVKTLLEETAAFEASDAYEFRQEVSVRSQRHVEYRLIAVERRPGSEAWPLIAGEAIQNLRAALDHTVYAASTASPKQREKTQFPITPSPEKFQGSLKRGRLTGVPDSVQAVVERAQPYNRTPDLPERDLLEVLRQLSNIDKHRTLATVATAIHHEFVGLAEGVDVKWDMPATGRRLGAGETHISTFTATSETDLEVEDAVPGFTYGVRILEIQPEGLAISFLKGIVHRVFEVVTECETGNRPRSGYPLV